MAGLLLFVPVLHPLLRPFVGLPSHLLWFAHTLPVAMVAYDSLSPVRDRHENPIACLVTVRDQSERLRREQMNRRAQSLSELGVMIASIAHELNNPLAAVVAYAELLRESGGATHRPRRISKPSPTKPGGLPVSLGSC